jgi:6-phosphogluconate dehydrogenase
MVRAAAVDATIDALARVAAKGDVIIDGGNSYYVDDIRRAKQLASRRRSLRRLRNERRRVERPGP